MKSSMAAPSLRNSGLLATSQSRPVSSRNRRAAAALVPTGTVLLMTTTASRSNRGAISADHGPQRGRSTEPSSADGVPTARKTSLAAAVAAARSAVKRNRPASTFRPTNSASPGS